MTEDEAFWFSVVEELDDPGLDEDPEFINLVGVTPEWVTKLGVEVLNLSMPRLQLHAGDKPTASKVGSMVGSHLALMNALTPAGGEESMQSQKLAEALKLAETFLGGLKVTSVAKKIPGRKEQFCDALAQSVRRISRRPIEDQYKFFASVARSMRPVKPLETSHGIPTAIAKRINTLAVYGVTWMHWRRFDALKSSKEAYDLLCKLLPVEVVGYDPERIRRMFSRAGKQFKAPGRPVAA